MDPFERAKSLGLELRIISEGESCRGDSKSMAQYEIMGLKEVIAARTLSQVVWFLDGFRFGVEKYKENN